MCSDREMDVLVRATKFTSRIKRVTISGYAITLQQRRKANNDIRPPDEAR